VGGLAQEASPTTDVLPGIMTAVDVLTGASSPPMLVSLLVAGDVEDNEERAAWPARLDCSSPSMRLSLSMISLSPASSLMPGSL
jgi:hypothetical protein